MIVKNHGLENLQKNTLWWPLHRLICKTTKSILTRIFFFLGVLRALLMKEILIKSNESDLRRVFCSFSLESFLWLWRNWGTTFLSDREVQNFIITQVFFLRKGIFRIPVGNAFISEEGRSLEGWQKEKIVERWKMSWKKSKTREYGTYDMIDR